MQIAIFISINVNREPRAMVLDLLLGSIGKRTWAAIWLKCWLLDIRSKVTGRKNPNTSFYIGEALSGANWPSWSFIWR